MIVNIPQVLGLAYALFVGALAFAIYGGIAGGLFGLLVFGRIAAIASTFGVFYGLKGGLFCGTIYALVKGRVGAIVGGLVGGAYAAASSVQILLDLGLRDREMAPLLGVPLIAVLASLAIHEAVARENRLLPLARSLGRALRQPSNTGWTLPTRFLLALAVVGFASVRILRLMGLIHNSHQ